MAAMALMFTRVSQSHGSKILLSAHLLSRDCQDMQSTLVLYNSRMKLACTYTFVRSNTEYNGYGGGIYSGAQCYLNKGVVKGVNGGREVKQLQERQRNCEI